MLTFLKGLLTALGEIFGFFKQNQLIEAGVDKVEAEQGKASVDVLIRAEKARDEARDMAAATPVTDSLPNDGHRRD